MGSLSFSEIFVILVVILIIFGPDRLPEFARKVGELIGKARAMTQEFTETMQSEYGEGVDSINSIADEFDGAKKDLSDAFGPVTGISSQASSPVPADDDHNPAVTDLTASSDFDDAADDDGLRP